MTPSGALASNGNAGVKVSKTVDSASLTPGLNLGLAVDLSSSIPGDTLTYSGLVSNVSSAFGVSGRFTAESHGDATSTLASYFDQLEYCATGCGNGFNRHWTAIAGAQMSQAGYAPVLTADATTGLALSAKGVPNGAVVYPSSGDGLLGTQIPAKNTAIWKYQAAFTLSPAQAALLSDPSQASSVRNHVHFEVTTRNASAAQPWDDTADVSNLFLSAVGASSASNASVTVTDPSGTATTVQLGTIVAGASAPFGVRFKVPSVAAKGARESDADYFARLAAAEGAKLTAGASATATGLSGPVGATAPPVTTTEHAPILGVTKTGPPSVDAGTIEVNPLTLANSGGAPASAIALTDALPNGAAGTVSGAPASLGPSAAAPATANYPVPLSQPGGALTDTATVTWKDANGNAYGPVSSSFTTTVKSSFFGATIALTPAIAGPDVVGTSQSFTALFRDRDGHPLSDQPLSFSVTGVNPATRTATTDATGAAVLSYSGASSGDDHVQATFTSGTLAIQSNTATVSWIVPIKAVSTTLVNGRFFPACCGSFTATPDMTPVFSQNFPTINFNPPQGTIPHQPCCVGVFNRPLTDITTDVAGNYSGSIVAQGTDAAGTLHQAGSGDLFQFNAVFTGQLTIAKAGDLTFNFFSDDGFIFSVGSGATRVGGSLNNPPPSMTSAFQGYPVMGSYNQPTAPIANNVTVHFPAAGMYPYELDYNECCAGQLALTMATGGSGLPPTGNLSLTPFSPPVRNVGQSQPFQVAAMDASGAPIGNVVVTLSVSGANPAQLQATTDSTGLASFNYQGGAAGTDSLQASAMVSGVPELSNTVNSTWNPAPPAPVITPPSPADGLSIRKPVPIDATITPPSGQTITSWQVTYQAMDPGPVQVLAGGPGAPPHPLAIFDPTLLTNDTYSIVVTATASGGGVQQAATTIAVTGNLKPGRYVTTSQDLNAFVSGYQIQVKRTYDSLDKSSGDFGIGWRVDLGNFRTAPNRVLGAGGWTQYNTQCFFGLCLTAFRNSAPRFVTVTFPDQHQEVFDFTPTGGTNIFFGGAAAFTARPGTGTTSTLEAIDSAISYNGDGNLYGSNGFYDPQRFKLTTRAGQVLMLDRTSGLVSESDPNGNSLSVSAAGVISSSGPSITFDRDAQARITSVHGPSGELVNYVYSAAGDLATYADANGNQTAYTYDANHNLLSMTGPNGPTQTLVYQGGRLTSVTDGSGNTSRIANDVGNQQQTVLDPNGRLTSVYTYDDLGDLTRLDRAFGGTTLTDSWTYDAVGNVTSHKDANGALSQGAFDSSGNLVRFLDSRGNQFDYAYNGFGQLTTITLNNTLVQTYLFDARGNQTEWDRPDGSKTFYTRNSAGLPIRVVDPAGRATNYSYDANGHLASATDNAGRTTSVRADTAGRITQVKDPLGNTTTYSFDGLGDVTSLTDANGHTWQYQWDLGSRMVRLTDPVGRSKSWTYDAAGRVQSTVDRTGTTAQYQYDAHGSLVKRTLLGGAATTYGYDGAGRLIDVANSDSDIRFTLDAGGRTVSTTSGGGAQPVEALTYAYDGEGNQTSLQGPEGPTAYSYDPWGLLTGVTDPAGGKFTINHDHQFRYLGLKRPNGVADALSYDAGDALLGISSAASSGANLSSLAYGLDSVGLATSVTSAAGISSFTRDAGGQLTAATYAGAPFPADSFSYDGVGNRINGSSYDAANRQLSSAGATFTHDAEGRQLSRADRSGLTTYDWNPLGQLLTIHYPDTTTTAYKYDGFGRRIEVNAAGTITRYTYDGDNIHSEYSGANTLTAWYLNGSGVDQVLEMSRGGTAYYYLRDRVGSTTAVVDSSGAVVDSYAYSAFGLQSATGSVTNPFTYTGREYDAKSGLYYFRARYYDPSTGRFLSEDPVPATNLYPYAANDPVTSNDPFGMEAAEYGALCEQDQVYVYVARTRLQKCYVGISNNLGRRFLEHGGLGKFSNWTAVARTGLNRLGARGLEQGLIEAQRAEVEAGRGLQLANRINSISKTADTYTGAVEFGQGIIDSLGLVQLLLTICGP